VPPSVSITTARRVVAREPGLVMVGTFGLALSVVCMVGVVVNGRTVTPEGDLFAAATFSFGVGVYAISVALLLPLAGYSPPARRRWRRASYVFLVYGLVLESMQAFRGLDPRFTEEGNTVDSVAGVVFGATAGLTTVLFVLLGLRFFRADVLVERPVLRLGIRYGVAAVGISFAVGVVMSVNNGRTIGDDGNLMVAHALGVHGLQAMPIVGLVVSAGPLAQPQRWIHAAGIGWLAACLAALMPALLGQSPLEPTTLTVAILGLVVWSAVAFRAVSSNAATAPMTSTAGEPTSTSASSSSRVRRVT
jgi:hypothetical protein